MNPDAARDLASLLAKQPGLDHIKVKKHGDSLLLFSGEGDQRWSHARLTALGRSTWGLSLGMSSGRWERTPFVGTMKDVTATLIENFAGYLEA